MAYQAVKKDGTPAKKPGPKPGGYNPGAFKKGHRLSAARTVEGRTLAQIARQFTADAVRIATDIMLSETARHADRLRAVEILLDRGWGRPKQDVFVAEVLPPEQLTDEQLLVIAGGDIVDAQFEDVGVAQSGDVPPEHLSRN